MTIGDLNKYYYYYYYYYYILQTEKMVGITVAILSATRRFLP